MLSMSYADVIATIKGRLMNFHVPSGERPIFIFSAPRSGSTYLLELLSIEPGMKVYDEPESISKPAARRELGVANWEDATILQKREVVYKQYFTKLINNQIPELNTPMYRRTGRLFTNRVAFKVLHGGEDIVPWFAETFGAYVVILVRHPIATSLSHEQLPRLPYFIQQESVRRRLNETQLRVIEGIIRNGNHFEKGILNWCLQYMFVLGPDRDADWAIISYEDLVTRPRETINYLSQKLNLRCAHRMLAGQNRPSISSVLSTQKMLADLERGKLGDRRVLIERWKAQVDDSMERRVFELLDLFEIDFYAYGKFVPSDRHRIQEEVTISDPLAGEAAAGN
jgi:Sulfotransferase family